MSAIGTIAATASLRLQGLTGKQIDLSPDELAAVSFDGAADKWFAFGHSIPTQRFDINLETGGNNSAFVLTRNAIDHGGHVGYSVRRRRSPSN